MASSTPTTLITPPTADPSASQSFIGSPGVTVGIGMVMIVVAIALWFRRQHQTDPCELAFRTVSRKMGLSRNQIEQIRRHAAEIDSCSPVGILMSPELTSRAWKSESLSNG